jgi:hypothetical protein
MKRVRLKGVVKLAQGVRRELSEPIAPGRLAKLQKWVSDALRSIHELLAFHKLELSALFGPSRKAYDYLAGVDFSKAQIRASAGRETPVSEVVRFRGLKSFFHRLLTDLSQAESEERVEELYRFLCQTSENIEHQIQTQGFRTDHLASGARAQRGWLAYFSRRENFDVYLAAIRTAKPIFDAAIGRSGKFRTPAILYFQPQKNVYKLRGDHEGTRISFPTGMIGFTVDQFLRLADFTLRLSRKNEEVFTALFNDPCRSIQAQIEELGGRVDRSAGKVYHLAQSFDRVNTLYFEGQIARPHLVWSKALTQRVFGHYNYAHDTVMVSRSLDHAEVPEFVVDFIMYHELLHKKLGLRWEKNRKKVHPPEFRREMEKFRQYEEAKTTIKRLAEK